MIHYEEVGKFEEILQKQKETRQEIMYEIEKIYQDPQQDQKIKMDIKNELKTYNLKRIIQYEDKKESEKILAGEIKLQELWNSYRKKITQNSKKDIDDQLKAWKKKSVLKYENEIELQKLLEREKILQKLWKIQKKELNKKEAIQRATKDILDELNAWLQQKLNNGEQEENLKQADWDKRKKKLQEMWEIYQTDKDELNHNSKDEIDIDDQLNKQEKDRKQQQKGKKVLELQQKLRRYELKKEWQIQKKKLNQEETIKTATKDIEDELDEWKKQKHIHLGQKKDLIQADLDNRKKELWEMWEIFQTDKNELHYDLEVEQDIENELKQWGKERIKHQKDEIVFELEKKLRGYELNKLWQIYKKERDEVEITEEAENNIDYELNTWEKERRERWDQKQSCVTFLFELNQLDFKKNENAYELFIKCLLGFFIIIWIAVNFLFQPILLILWIVMFIPLKIILIIGLNLPGNKYNLTFNYKGKKQYQDNCCALSSVFIVLFLAFYLYISFQGVGINLNVTQQNMLFASNKNISKNYSAISYIPLNKNQSIFLQKLPSLYLKNFDQSLDICSDYKKADNSKKLSYIQLRINISDGLSTVPITQSLECLSQIKTDGQNNFQFQAISFYVNDNFSDWLLKTADSEFIMNQQLYADFPQGKNNLKVNMNGDIRIQNNSYEIVFDKNILCTSSSTQNAQLVYYDVQLNSEFQSPANIEDFFITNSAMIGQNTQSINICQASVLSQQFQLRKKFTPEPLDKWQELFYDINPLGKRGMYYAYTVDNTVDYNIEQNDFSFKDSFAHFKFNFAQSKKDFMIKITLERSTLLQAIKNVGSLIPFILSIHTFILALVIPGWFDQKVQQEHKIQLIQMSYEESINQKKTDDELKEQQKRRELIEEEISNYYEIEKQEDPREINKKNRYNYQYDSKNIKKIQIKNHQFKNMVEKVTLQREMKQFEKDGKVQDQLNAIFSYQGFVDLNFKAQKQEKQNEENEKKIQTLEQQMLQLNKQMQLIRSSQTQN